MGLLEQQYICDNQLCKKKYNLKDGYVKLEMKSMYLQEYIFCNEKCCMKFLEIENLPIEDIEEENE